MRNKSNSIKLNIFLAIVLAGLILLPSSTETAYGCDFHSWDFFMESSQFVIGVVVATSGSEVAIEVTDSFAPHFIPSELLIETSEIIYFPSDRWRRYERLEQGDYVVAALNECPCCERDSNIFHVTSLDYATLQVIDDADGPTLRMLTDFVNHRATYIHRFRSPRVYRQNRQNPMGFTVAYDPTSLILGEITALERGEVTIEIWDYITPEGAELAFDYLRWYWDDIDGFSDFSVGDDIAVNLWLPTGGRESRTLTATSTTVFSINTLDDGSMELEHSRDASLSAFYTDFLGHRGSYPNVVTFGESSQPQRYRSVARLVDDELIMIYGQVRVIEAQVESIDMIDIELLTSWDTTGINSNWITLTFVLAGIGGVLVVAMVVLVVKIKKQVLREEK